jgi:hypothetical protein
MSCGQAVTLPGKVGSGVEGQQDHSMLSLVRLKTGRRWGTGSAGGGFVGKVRCIINLKNRGAGIPDGGFFTQDQFQKFTDAGDLALTVGGAMVEKTA